MSNDNMSDNELELRPYQLAAIELLRDVGKATIYQARKKIERAANLVIDDTLYDRVSAAFKTTDPLAIQHIIAAMRYETEGRINRSEPGYPFTWQVMQDKTVLLLSNINFTLPIRRKADLRASTAFGWVFVGFHHGEPS